MVIPRRALWQCRSRELPTQTLIPAEGSLFGFNWSAPAGDSNLFAGIHKHYQGSQNIPTSDVEGGSLAAAFLRVPTSLCRERGSRRRPAGEVASPVHFAGGFA